MVAVAAVALFLLQGAAPGGRLQQGVLVRPDTVTVGDPFAVIVTIRAPRGAVIEFPQTPDSGAAVEAIDPVQVTPSADTTVTENTAVYRVAAWDIGRLAVPFQDIIVRQGSDVRRVRLAGVSVFVRSVLPADSSLRVPKPARDVMSFGPPWWMWLLAGLVAAALLWLMWWLWKRRRRRGPAVIDPYLHARTEFDRVDALGLVAAGERTRHVALMAEVLRDYLARVVPAALPSLTTSELLAVLRGSASAPSQRLAAFLSEVDLVKFAKRPLTSERALDLGREARAIAEAVHQITSAPRLEQAA